MKVNIVCYDTAWIFGKISKKLDEELRKLSVDSTISGKPDPSADINHHFEYNNYDGKKHSLDTTSVTHVDSLLKLRDLKKKMPNMEMGICMSRMTMEGLAEEGIERSKLCYVSPGHDGVIKPRKTALGVTSRVYPDGRKKEETLIELSEKISPEEFMFKIVGSGWEEIIDTLRRRSFEVEYYPEFDYETYVKLVPTFDYFLYFAFDEGNMGFVDALAAGVKTIVTPQGYHLDPHDGITYSINDTQDILKALEEVAEEKRKLVRSVQDWTWENYAKKHVDIWNYLLSDDRETFLRNYKGGCDDGLSSLQQQEDHFKGQKKLFFRPVKAKSLIKAPIHMIKNKLKKK